MKIPEPTKIPSHPNDIKYAASAGVAIPPAAKLTTGSLPSFAVSLTISYETLNSRANLTKSWSSPESYIDFTILSSSFTFLMWVIASATFPVPGSPFVLIIAAPSSILLNASAKDLAPFTKGVVKSHFQIWWVSSAGVNTSDSSIISTSVSSKTLAS